MTRLDDSIAVGAYAFSSPEGQQTHHTVPSRLVGNGKSRPSTLSLPHKHALGRANAARVRERKDTGRENGSIFLTPRRVP